MKLPCDDDDNGNDDVWQYGNVAIMAMCGNDMKKPEQVRHWSGSGPVQVEHEEWQATHSADDVER